MKKEILKNNEPSFLIDIKRVREVLVYSTLTNEYFKIRKLEVLKAAQQTEIRYRITNKIFKVTRDTMVII